MSEKEFRELEEICEKNHNRVKWAEEYRDMREPVLQFPGKEKIKAHRKMRRLMTAMLACAAACGVGVTFVVIGITDMNVRAMITGGIVTAVFLITGCICDAQLEDGVAYV